MKRFSSAADRLLMQFYTQLLEVYPGDMNGPPLEVNMHKIMLYYSIGLQVLLTLIGKEVPLTLIGLMSF